MRFCQYCTYAIASLLLLLQLASALEQARQPNSTANTTHAKVGVINDLIAQSGFSQDDVSILVKNITRNQDVFSINANIPRNPASVTKLLTTGVGLLLLGEDYRWQTDFYAVGEINEGVLEGDFVIKGYGNPYFVEERLEEAVAAIRATGLRKITGDLLIDASYFRRDETHPGHFDGRGVEPYNAIPSAVSINFRTAELIYKTSKSGVKLSTRPKLFYTLLKNQIKLNHKPCHQGFNPKITVNQGSDVVVVSGSVSSKCGTKRQTKVITDAGDLLAGHFRRAWLASGGEFDGVWYYDVTQPSYRLIYRLYSKSLSEQIKAMNRFSNNLMTRQLFLTLGARHSTQQATLKNSRMIVSEALRAQGLRLENFYIDNGSGLSRQTRMTAQDIAKLLEVMANSKYAAAFYSSLSEAGRSGTMKKRLRNTPLEANFRGKTGTLNKVKALAGYYNNSAGEKLAFIMIIHAQGAKYAGNLIDQVLLQIYE